MQLRQSAGRLRRRSQICAGLPLPGLPAPDRLGVRRQRLFSPEAGRRKRRRQDFRPGRTGWAQAADSLLSAMRHLALLDLGYAPRIYRRRGRRLRRSRFPGAGSFHLGAIAPCLARLRAPAVASGPPAWLTLQKKKAASQDRPFLETGVLLRT